MAYAPSGNNTTSAGLAHLATVNAGVNAGTIAAL